MDGTSNANFDKLDLVPDQKRFGGELLKTRLPEGDHFYNRIDGVRFDFTESQFVRPIA